MSAILEILECKLPNIESERPIYWRSLENACEQVPPPYGEEWYGELFREHAKDIDWIAKILILNAKKEADGARQLWSFAGRIEDQSVSERVQQHAIDEARHSLFYVAMLNLMFPDEYTVEEIEELRDYVPKFEMGIIPSSGKFATKDEILDEIIQMNIGEIRTLINQMLMRPVIDAFTNEENRSKALKLIDNLGGDELRHISYTADIIDEFDDLKGTDHFMTLRMEEFNQITQKELNRKDIVVFD